MIKFRQKNYTIQEAHYTGPKDMDKVPGAVEMMMKGAGLGAGGGAVVGAIMKEHKVLDDALTGAKWGTLGGIAAKLLLNYIHKPMSSVKYQEVDKNIRRQFGIYRVSGITVGDNLGKRASVEERFSFNDRNVSDYKINIAIHNNQVVLYTFGINSEELEKLNKSLDYYCKKYFSMEYVAKVINLNANSYSVNITFTNYQVLSNFIMEISESLGCKINLLNSGAIVEPRLRETDEKNFSVPSINKYDLQKIITTGLVKGIFGAVKFRGGRLCNTVQALLTEAIDQMSKADRIKAGFPIVRVGDLNNVFLEKELNKLHYIDGFNYTTGTKEPKEVNMTMLSGVLLISATKDEAKNIDEGLWKSMKTKINRSDTGGIITYTYPVQSFNELDMVLKKFMNACKSVPNIFG